MLVSAARDLAMRLFHERGFGSVGVDLIGESAGMSGPAIYRYFSGKEEILVVPLDEAIDWVLLATGGIRRSRRAVTRSRAWTCEQCPATARTDGNLDQERNAIPKQYRARLRSRRNRYIDRWVDCLQRCHPDQPREAVVAAVHMVHGLINSASSWPPQVLKVNHLEDLIAHVAFSGMDSRSSFALDK